MAYLSYITVEYSPVKKIKPWYCEIISVSYLLPAEMCRFDTLWRTEWFFWTRDNSLIQYVACLWSLSLFLSLFFSLSNPDPKNKLYVQCCIMLLTIIARICVSSTVTPTKFVPHTHSLVNPVKRSQEWGWKKSVFFLFFTVLPLYLFSNFNLLCLTATK